MRYEAFISYRHGDIDEDVAVRVQKEIEKYKVPKKIATRIGKKHVGKAFRDSDELHASSDLSAVIREALNESEWLIAICSPRYLESEWCHQEIEYFVNLRGQEKVIVILVDGEPRETFPRELTEKEVDGQIMEIEPLAVDIRGESKKDILKNLGRERFRFLSSILSVGYDDLRNRQRERRIRRIVAATASAFVVLAGVIGVITVKNIELNRAYEELDQSNEELAQSYDELEQTNKELDQSNQATLRGESYYLAEYAEQAYREDDRETAIKLALSALPKDLKNPDRPYVPDAVRALTSVTGIYDYSAGYHVGFNNTAEYETFDAFSRFSEDGSLVLIERRRVEDGKSYDRTVSVFRVSDGEKLCEYREADTNDNDFCAQSRAAEFSDDAKRLYYLSENGLTCVGIDDGKEYFTAEAADDMRVDMSAGPGQTAIVTIDHDNGLMYGYDLSGEKTLSLKLRKKEFYDMGVIDPKSGRLPIIGSYGIHVIDIHTGEKKHYSRKGGLASPVAFVDEDHLVYRVTAPSGDYMFIESYNVKTGERKELSKPGHSINNGNMMAITDKGTCYYYQSNTIFELDVCCGKNKKLWEYELPSEIETITYGDGLVAIGCKDGSMYAFKEEGKRQIPTPAGNGKTVVTLSISKNAYVTSDYRGRTVRVYRTQESEFHSASGQASIADLTGGEVPYAWNAADTNCSHFLLSLWLYPERKLLAYDSTTMERTGIREITEYGDTCDYKQRDDEYVYFCSYDTNTLYHFDSTLTKETYNLENIEQKYYYREDGKILYESSDQKMRMIEAATGKVLEEEDIPNGFLYEVKLGDRLLLGSGDEVRIDDSDGNTETTLEDVELVKINEERGLIICLSKKGDTWKIYDVNKQQMVLEEKVVGSYEEMQFFGDNRYVFKDYTEIYDMDTWEKVLTLKLENGEPYGAYTTKDCPFFVVWTRSTEDNRESVESAVLYEKDGNGETVGVINNFVALTPDNQVVAYDGDQTLYKFPLLTVEEIMEKAKQMVGNTEFTEDQKEKYHLFR